MADSYKYKLKNDETIQIVHNATCFSSFNVAISSQLTENNIEFASIIIENHKIQYIDLKYFDYIKEIGVIPFELKQDNKELELKFEINKIRNKSQLQYTGMIVRCFYEDFINKGGDNFILIAKHFMNLCEFFPNEDKGKLFTIACNIFINTENTNYNGNHILMEGLYSNNNSCKILTTEEIIKVLNKNTGINQHFKDIVTKEELIKYKLIDESKDSYAKTL